MHAAEVACTRCHRWPREDGSAWCGACIDSVLGVNREPMPPLWRAIWMLVPLAIAALSVWMVLR